MSVIMLAEEMDYLTEDEVYLMEAAENLVESIKANVENYLLEAEANIAIDPSAATKKDVVAEAEKKAGAIRTKINQLMAKLKTLGGKQKTFVLIQIEHLKKSIAYLIGKARVLAASATNKPTAQQDLTDALKVYDDKILALKNEMKNPTA